MLGNDLFGYTFAEITHTIGASGSISLIPIIIFVVLAAALIFVLSFLPKKFQVNKVVGYALALISLLYLATGVSNNDNAEGLSADIEKNLVINKSEYFYSSAYSYFNPSTYEPDIYSDTYLVDYLEQFAKNETFEYIEETEYPFLHRSIDRDVLTPFFDTRQKSPDIVIILVEGLGRAFTNKGAYLGNFTPFLDSLSTKSLYWPNFLSNGGRTFAVLPSLLGSLPFGEKGFMEMEERMPEQMSLLNLLKNNGYQTSFFYGGNSEFDDMAEYLNKNSIDQINDQASFSSDYKKIPASSTGFSWGYGDKELFRNYFEKRSTETEKPALDILLTVSMHSPFEIDEPEKYDRKFEERLEEFGFDEEKKERYQNYKKQYTSILFADDALKNFFQTYRERENFDNTIFIITGDHRIPEIPMASKIDRYHVPMIIYSPLLKRTATFEAVSSHFDLAPSMTAFLEENYDIEVPEINSYIGHGLDTSRSFRNIHSIPLKQTKTNLIDFVMGEYHLNGDQLFKLDRELKEEKLEDEVKKEELISAFAQFKRKNAEIGQGKRILPDSITRKYIAR